MQQPTKLQCKWIKCEVRVMNEGRMREKHHVMVVQWPYLAIVGVLTMWFHQKVISAVGASKVCKTSLQSVYILDYT
jgi:hypothetical protein